jgi:signal transduction histidine kinase
MKKDIPATKTELRQNAEKVLYKRMKESANPSSESDQLRLIHELEVHQIELEMINEDLSHANEKIKNLANKYSDLFDFAPIGYFILDSVGKILDLNLIGAKMLGESRSQLKNSLLAFFVARESNLAFNGFMDEIFTSHTKGECELKLTNMEDGQLFVRLSGIAQPGKEDCFVTMIDISQRKNAEYIVQQRNNEIGAKNEELILMNEYLNITNQKSQESDRLKSAFLANMSHEIRTPMNGILGFAELLKDRNLSLVDQQEYIQIIEKSGIRMLNIINEIIDISKIESQQMFLAMSVTDLNEQIRFVHTFFQPEATRKGLQLKCATGLEGKQALVMMDKEKLYAILINLVKNAIKFTDSGSISFGYQLIASKSANCRMAGKKELEFFIHDTGIGIPKERQQAIFERFIQADITDIHAYQGAGLGLTISKSYVEMLGGRIWVDSNPEVKAGAQGSTFYFTLPYDPASSKTMEPELAAITPDTRKQLSKLSILIVEDDQMSKLLLKNILRTSSKEVYYAAKGSEAIEMCKLHPDIDLIMMDIRLPEMDGYLATRQIREFNKKAVIIAQTSFALKGDREEALAAGCNGYISKPIDNKALVKLVNEFF